MKTSTVVCKAGYHSGRRKLWCAIQLVGMTLKNKYADSLRFLDTYPQLRHNCQIEKKKKLAISMVFQSTSIVLLYCTILLKLSFEG